jgi:hypothetical protein
MDTRGVQDHHSSLGVLIYFLQFSVLHKGAECQLVVLQELVEFGILNKINIKYNFYLPVILQNLIQA